MRELPPLNALKAFEASGRCLNFRVAADELGVTQGAVAQQVRALERALAVTLFHRGARGVALTEEGRRYFASVRRAFDLLAEATDEIRPRDAIVTVSATPSFAARWLVPRMGPFSQKHPTLRVRIEATERLANFRSDGVDIAVRRGRPPFGPGLSWTPLLPSELIVVCHPSLANGPRPIRRACDLFHHVLLEDSHGYWPILLEQILDGPAAPKFRYMTFSQTTLAIEAAISQQGVALADRAFVEDELKTGLLVQPFASSIEPGAGYFVVSAREPHNRSAVETVRAWLTQIHGEPPS